MCLRCAQMFSDVHRCFQMITDVFEFSLDRDAAVSSRSFDRLKVSGLKISVSNMRENMLFSGEIYTVDKTFILSPVVSVVTNIKLLYKNGKY